MDVPSLLYGLVFDHTLRTVALGAGTLGIVSGALGSFAVLRKQSLLGDAISHTALPGIALAFLLTEVLAIVTGWALDSKAPLVLVAGAAVAGWIGTLLIMGIVRTTRIKYDAALGLILSVLFGLGLVLLTFIQRMPTAAQAGLDKFLFGQAATTLQRDVWTMAGLGALALLTMLLFWKEFKLLSFDPDFGACLGFRMRLLDVLLTSLLVIAIVLGLQMVGVVLMSAMVVAPAAAARQWTDRLGIMVALAGLFGALAGVSGAVLSSSTQHVPAGPTIVLSISGVVVISLLLAPNRGLIWNGVRQWRQRRQLRLDAVLGDLYALAGQHTELEHGHPVAVLEAMSAGPAARSSLEALAARGLARQHAAAHWAITPEGRAEVEGRLRHGD